MSTPASAEPTEADVQFARERLHGDYCSDPSPVLVDAVAWALASQRAEIVARYEAVANELKTLAEQASRPGGGFPFEAGVRITAEDAAARIREAAPK